MPTAVVAYGPTDIFRQGIKVSHQFLNALAGQFIMPFKRGIQLGNISGMVFVMVNFHRLRVDMGLERIIRVRKIWYCISHILYLCVKGRKLTGGQPEDKHE